MMTSFAGLVVRLYPRGLVYSAHLINSSDQNKYAHFRHVVSNCIPEAALAHDRYDCSDGCPVEATLELIGGKWKGVALYHLLDGPIRFNSLKRRLSDVTQRMLIRQLRELEEDGLVTRTVYAEVPPRVDYRLTEKGETLRPLILAMKAWGEKFAAPAAKAHISAARS